MKNVKAFVKVRFIKDLPLYAKKWFSHSLLTLADSCSQRKNAGYGSKRITRYYYEESSKICLSFVYLGLGGNRNNFMTLNECRETCAGKE